MWLSAASKAARCCRVAILGARPDAREQRSSEERQARSHNRHTKKAGRGSRTYLSPVSPLPRNGLAVAVEAAGWALLAKEGRPHDRGSTVFDSPRRVLATHIGAHPARTDGVHANTSPGELSGEETRQRVQAGLGHAVRRIRASRLAGGVRSSRRRRKSSSVQRGGRGSWQGLRNSMRRLAGKPESSPAPLETMTMLPPAESESSSPSVTRNGPRKIGFNRSPRHLGVEAVERDAGIVDQNVELDVVRDETLGERRDARRARHVERAILDVDPLGRKALRRRSSFALVPGGQDDPELPLPKLAAGLQAETPASARYQSHRHIGPRTCKPWRRYR